MPKFNGFKRNNGNFMIHLCDFNGYDLQLC